MEAAVEWTNTIDCGSSQSQKDVHKGVLHHKLVNLTLDWEFAAMTLDAQRYKSQTPLERESLRDSATIYRKCISEVTELLTAPSNTGGLSCA